MTCDSKEHRLSASLSFLRRPADETHQITGRDQHKKLRKRPVSLEKFVEDSIERAGASVSITLHAPVGKAQKLPGQASGNLLAACKPVCQ